MDNRIKAILPSTQILSWRTVILTAAVFGAVFLILQRSVKYICQNIFAFDCPPYFPISIFELRFPSIQDLTLAAVCLAGFFLIVRILEFRKYDIRLVAVFAILLIVGTNLIQGFNTGLYAPISGDYRGSTLVTNTPDGQEYYHDAIRIDNPLQFLKDHNNLQLSLSQHGRTHPPGAILTYYFLYRIFGDPALIGIAICLIASVITVFGAYEFYRSQLSDETARYMTFLFMLLPAIQIYYYSTIDGIVTGLLTLSLALFCFSKTRVGILAGTFSLIAAFFLTFASLFLLPVLAGYDILVKRSVRRTIIVMAGLMSFYLILYFITGYNQWMSFRTASIYENPGGFSLFNTPANYFFTRFENIAEIILFLGPFLFLLFIRGIRDLISPSLRVLTFLGIAVLLAMFATGAWKTGETSRACAFIYPFLLLPVGAYLDRQQAISTEKLKLSVLVILQTVAMQSFGFYMW